MAQQNNYFAYNIIDAIYYGSPSGEQMKDIYGAEYYRRNELESITDDDIKNNFNEHEKEFIKAVINKYIMNDNIKSSYIDRYEDNNDISYTYISPNSYMPIQLSNMISNVNGMHIYKLLSAKDIDFDNVILPNSAISNEYNWGLFDIRRRWGDKPIHINNTFELLNVIDYLLCACNNLWNELYKLKYDENDSVDIWFVADPNNDIYILESNKITEDNFKKDTRYEIKLLTLLNPTEYSTKIKTVHSSKTGTNTNLGIGTNFTKSEEDNGTDLYFIRKVIDNYSHKSIVNNIKVAEFNNSETLSQILIENPVYSTSIPLNGELYNINGYLIGDDLYVYPGSHSKNFLIDDKNKIYTPNDVKDLIDFNNRKLYYDLYFISNANNFTEYKKVYVEFLFNYKKNNDDLLHPCILYYVDDDNNKIILSIIPLDKTYFDNNSASISFYNESLNSSLSSNDGTNFLTNEIKLYNILKIILNNEYNLSCLNGFNDYENVINSSNPTIENFNDDNYTRNVNYADNKEIIGEDKYIICKRPIFYKISDEFKFKFELTLPATRYTAETNTEIIIYYYKNDNNIDCELYSENKNINEQELIQDLKNISISSDNDVNTLNKINISNDSLQNGSILYDTKRYIIPHNRNIYFKINASYIIGYPEDYDDTLGIQENENEFINPLNIKKDDEYLDKIITEKPLINSNEINEKYYSYFKFTGTNNHQRTFLNLDNSDIIDLSNTNYYNKNVNKQYYPIWEKINQPYKILYDIIPNSLISQENDFNDIKTEINSIINNNAFKQISYNLYKFNYTISNENIEQIKFNLNLFINETSKVKNNICTVPINLNKIYEPKIYFMGSSIIDEELNNNNYNIEHEYKFYNTQHNTTEGYPETGSSTLKDIMQNNIYGCLKKYTKTITVNNTTVNHITYCDINKELNTTLGTLEENKKYDNSENIIFDISYHKNIKYVNLLGSLYTDEKLSNKINSTNSPVKNGTSFKINNEYFTDYNYLSTFCLFNIHGFSKNYRLHGYNKKLIYYGSDSTQWPDGYPEICSAYFDTLSICTTNSINSINKYLNIKITDNEYDEFNNPNRQFYQLSYISYLNEDNNFIWTHNGEDFKEGYNIENNDYILKTIPINIVNTTYEFNVQNFVSSLEGDISDEGLYTTYYINISYMEVNSSTFYPPFNSFPKNKEYDLNDQDDVEAYKNYVTCWGIGNNNNGEDPAENNYRPITLSLKLQENLNYTSPYFTESNKASLKFNIKRQKRDVNDNTNNTLDNTPTSNNNIFICLNSRYYLSDFIELQGTNILPSGSYLYYDNYTYSYLIHEFKNNKGSKNDMHYTYVNKSDTTFNNNILYKIITGQENNNLIDYNCKIPYPIFYYEDNNITTYNYDIVRISDINKYLLTNIDGSKNKHVKITLNNAADVKNNENKYDYDTESDRLFNNNSFYYDHILSYIQFNNIDSQFDYSYSRSNIFQNSAITLDDYSASELYNSKNYYGQTFPRTSAGHKIFKICPIVRNKIDYNNKFGNDLSNINDYIYDENYQLYHIYSTQEINSTNIEFEFFEFKYDDIYLLSIYYDNNDTEQKWKIQLGDKINGNNNIKLFETKSQEDSLQNYFDKLKEYYKLQLKYFLINTAIDESSTSTDTNKKTVYYVLCTSNIINSLNNAYQLELNIE